MKKLLTGLLLLTLGVPQVEAAEAQNDSPQFFIEKHTVKRQDTLSGILHKRGIARDDLYEGAWLERNIKANSKIKQHNLIFPGDVLTLLLPNYLKVPPKEEVLSSKPEVVPSPDNSPEPLQKNEEAPLIAPEKDLGNPVIADPVPTEKEENNSWEVKIKRSLSLYKLTSLSFNFLSDNFYGAVTFDYAPLSKLSHNFQLSRQLTKIEAGHAFSLASTDHKILMLGRFSADSTQIRGDRKTFLGLKQQDKIEKKGNELGYGVHLVQKCTWFESDLYWNQDFSFGASRPGLTAATVGLDLKIAAFKLSKETALDGMLFAAIDQLALKGEEPFSQGSDAIDIKYRYGYAGIGLILRTSK